MGQDDFKKIIIEAEKEMGKAPYDDKKTREYIEKITKRTLEDYEKNILARQNNGGENLRKFNEDLYEIAMVEGEEAEKIRNSDREREKEAEREAERIYKNKFDNV